jgi:hypothetical protein
MVEVKAGVVEGVEGVADIVRVPVVFSVTVKEGVGEGCCVHLLGDGPELGDWDVNRLPN